MGYRHFWKFPIYKIFHEEDGKTYQRTEVKGIFCLYHAGKSYGCITSALQMMVNASDA